MLINAASFDQPDLYCKWSDKNSNFQYSSPQFCFGSIDCGWGDTCNTPDDTANAFPPVNARVIAPDGSWDLWFDGDVFVSNMDNTLDVTISQTFAMSNRFFEFTYYDYDCDTLLNHSISLVDWDYSAGLSDHEYIQTFATLNSTRK